MSSSALDAGITVVVPVRDEEGTLATGLESLLRQTVGAAALEVLVFDGQSTDGTALEASRFRSRAPWRRFEVISNPARTVPHALNAGLAASTCRWFTRLDGRVAFSPGYLEQCLRERERLGPLTAVGGRFSAASAGSVPDAIAAAVTHPAGVGRGFRTVDGALVEVPHHPFAIWAADDVRALGGFDERLTRNQDDEFSMRARRSGSRIFSTNRAEVTYRPREGFRSLAAQYAQYGLWKSAVGRRHGLFPLQSLVPAAGAIAVLAAASCAITGSRRWPLLSIGAAYGALGVHASRAGGGANPLLTGAAMATVHVSYGVGVVGGALAPALCDTHIGAGRVR